MKKKDHGIEKEVDALGRVVLPKNFRTRLGIDTNTKVIISIDGEGLNIKPTQSTCAICKKHTEIIAELKICTDCFENIKKYEEKK